jgi:hypothetical protein
MVSHSFELLNRERTRANRILLKRWDRYCAILQSSKPEISSFSFRGLREPNATSLAPMPVPLRSNPLRTALRMAEQVAGKCLYDLN